MVEDDKDSRTLLADDLPNWKYNVVEASYNTGCQIFWGDNGGKANGL
jgi:CheY-like chemotaxis protein